jgi:hypothetical protein
MYPGYLELDRVTDMFVDRDKIERHQRQLTVRSFRCSMLLVPTLIHEYHHQKRAETDMIIVE